MKNEITIFYVAEDKAPFLEWLNSLDKKTQFRILQRIERVKYGNYGDFKKIDISLYELRFFFGSGYRVYYGKDGDKVILILSGGDKKSQKKDISKAKEYWRLYNEQKK